MLMMQQPGARPSYRGNRRWARETLIFGQESAKSSDGYFQHGPGVTGSAARGYRMEKPGRVVAVSVTGNISSAIGALNTLRIETRAGGSEISSALRIEFTAADGTGDKTKGVADVRGAHFAAGALLQSYLEVVAFGGGALSNTTIRITVETFA